MDDDLYSKLHCDDHGVVTLKKDGVSFISMRKKYREEEYCDIYRKTLQHEIHHIIWFFLLNDGKVSIYDDDDNLWLAYRIFQDEVIARTCSGGVMMGYSHLLLMDGAALNKLRMQEPGKEEQINQTVTNLNTLLYDEIKPLMEDADLGQQDIIFSVMDAQNFEDLENNLQKYKTAIEPLAEKNRMLRLQEKSPEKTGDGLYLEI